MYKLSVFVFLAVTAWSRPVHLRCDYRENPLGIDNMQPTVSWRSDDAGRNWHQKAYELMVSSTPASLRSGKPDVWDSSKQYSSDSNNIPYGGPALESGRRYYWTVRVWDADNKMSEPAAPAWWEMGLLNKSAWKAKWIRWENPEDAADRAGMHWIWVGGADANAVAPTTVATFRTTLSLDATPKTAALFVASHGDYEATANGRPVGSKRGWSLFDRQEIGYALVRGKNTIEIKVTVQPRPPFGPEAGNPTSPRPAGLAALVKVTMADGSIKRVATDTDWEAEGKPTAIVAELGSNTLGADPGALPQPASLLRQEFMIGKPVKSARVYVTALGSYQLSINQKGVTADVLTPEFTDYFKRVTYQTYDVTSLLKRGSNAIEALLGDGWFASGMAWNGFHFRVLPPTRFLAQIQIDYADGTSDTVATDTNWKASQSNILHSEIYAGEVLDARYEPKWSNAVAGDPPPGFITSQTTTPVHLLQSLKPKSITALPDNMWLVDMGQNMVGWMALKVSGKPGATIRLRFAEILKPEGGIYTQNLRNADATDTFVLRGKGVETLRPHFTFHGFRYVEISGFPGKPGIGDLTGEVLSSIDGPPTGTLTTSNDLLNRMWNIGLWGERGNFLSIPTDCPQRDERLGWMGDAGVFWRTGAYNYDIASFTHKWMNDVVDAQTPAGAFTNTSPDLGLGTGVDGAPGWGDAGIIVPWTAWMQYGDTSIINQNWDAMQRWMEYIHSANPDYVRKKAVGPNFGDWLAPNSETAGDLIGTAYWAWNADMMAQMAGATNRTDQAQRYTGLFNSIRSAFQKAFVKDNGEVANGSQTSYVLALQMKLLPESLVPAAVSNLVKDIDAHGGHLTTGFLGTPHLLFALSENGRADVAYRLILTDTYPSWGYMLSKGATTWWERWNGDTGDPAMNSFNHYAFGSVVAWIYRSVAGIDTAAAAPGFREIVIHPLTSGPITHARGEYESVYGKIVSDWSTEQNGALVLRVTIPPNTTAKVYLPAKTGDHVTEGGKPTETKPGADNTVIASIGSGSYEFHVN